MPVIDCSQAPAGWQNRSPVTASRLPVQVKPRAKLKGANITLKPGYGPDPRYYWAELIWGNAWDWTGWIKWQVDLAVASGCNAIRLMGGTDGVAHGMYTRSTYFAQVQQLIEYCASLGLYYYATVAGDYGTPRNQAMLEETVAFCQFVQTFPNVIAIDMFNEYDKWMDWLASQEPDGVLTQEQRVIFKSDLIGWINAVRAAGVRLPLTVSTGAGSLSYHAQSWQFYFRDFVDFIDPHQYGGTAAISVSPVASLRLPILCGEFGASMDHTIQHRTNRYNQMKAFAALPEVVGVFQWAITDQSTSASDKWGLYDIDGVRRADIADIFETFPTAY